MDKKEMDILRSSTLYSDEILQVRCINKKYANFFNGDPINTFTKMNKKSGLPYPQPKWVACSYYIIDSDGDQYQIAEDRYGKINKNFEWIKND